MKAIYFFSALMFFMTGYGQMQLTQNCAIPSMGIATNSEVVLVYSFGELFVNEINQNTIQLSEGAVHSKLEEKLQTKEFSRIENLKVFPNPTQDILQIDFGRVSNYEVYIFDIIGKEICSYIVTQDFHQMDLNKLPNGVYLLFAIDRDNNKATSVKFQKI